MYNSDIKESIYRILCDLIKADNIIKTEEMELLDAKIKEFAIDRQHKRSSFDMTLSEAVSKIQKQKRKTLNGKVIRSLKECALKDGECTRDEAMLISAIDIALNGKGKIHSIPFSNRPILSNQLLFIDKTYNPVKNELDRNFRELSRIVEMSGFELVYIPQIAKEFKEYTDKEELRLFLSIINPTLDDDLFDIKIFNLQNMDSRYFYLNVLNNKLDMDLSIDEPSWLMRLPNSVVKGTGFANFLTYHVEMGNMKEQLTGFLENLNSMQGSYSILVNRHSNIGYNFLYEGFHKALVDVISIEPDDNCMLKIYPTTYPVGTETIVLEKGKTVIPINLIGRDAAFLIMLLCGSISDERGISFNVDEHDKTIIQEQYTNIYNQVGIRSRIPSITEPYLFRTIISRIARALDDCAESNNWIKQLKPQKKAKGDYYIPFPKERIFIKKKADKKSEQEKFDLLKDSRIYETYLTLSKKRHLVKR